MLVRWALLLGLACLTVVSCTRSVEDTAGGVAATPGESGEPLQELALTATVVDIGDAAEPGEMVCPGNGAIDDASFDGFGGPAHEKTPLEILHGVLAGSLLGNDLERALGSWEQTGHATLDIPNDQQAWDLTRSDALAALLVDASATDVRLNIWIVDPAGPAGEERGSATFQLGEEGWRLTQYSICSLLLSGVDYEQPTPQVLSEKERQELEAADRLDTLSGGGEPDD